MLISFYRQLFVGKNDDVHFCHNLEDGLQWVRDHLVICLALKLYRAWVTVCTTCFNVSDLACCPHSVFMDLICFSE